MTSTPSARPPDADLTGREIVVGVSGGIAAYKTCTVVSRLVQRGAGVTVCMTHGGTRFVTPLTFQSLTAREVFVSVFDSETHYDPQHLSLTAATNLVILAPATANLIGKIAAGIADDLMTTLVLGVQCPILMAPAMNTRMWDNSLVQRNMRQLRELGFHTVGPNEGWLACREVGAGRMAEPEEIVAAAVKLLGGEKILTERDSTTVPR